MATLPNLTFDSFVDDLGTALDAKLDTVQARSVRFILSYCELHGVTDRRQMAYILGTAWHEAAFRPIKERRAGTGTPGQRKIRAMQDRYWKTGYFGRGLVQLTWRANYEKFALLLNLPLVTNPDLVMDPKIGAEILVLGMAKGYFTGVRLADFFRPEYDSDLAWLDARQIVNGNFHDDRVAGAALKILRVIQKYYPPKHTT